MEYRCYYTGEQQIIIDLLASVFSRAADENEGALIAKLAQDLFETTDDNDFYNFVAVEGDTLIGSAFFTRLTFDKPINTFILGPIAVEDRFQGKKIGQNLINFGLEQLRQAGIDLAMTYGDPNYYQKVGFMPVSSEHIIPPLTLSHSHGWLGQSLTDKSIESYSGQTSCVTAFDNPAYW